MAQMDAWVSHFAKAPRVREFEDLTVEAAVAAVADLGCFAVVIDIPTPDNLGIHLDGRTNRVYLIATGGHVHRAYRC